ncbi:MAG: hypothetical protein HYX34_02490 [Actinobacteria bacterium]|nr:hypothetical protein [Actinomycetota bacterium]
MMISAGVLVAGLFVWRWWTAEPWAELEKTAATFTAPVGFNPRTRFYRVGDRSAICDIKPSCENARLTFQFEQSRPGDDPCALLRASISQWRRRFGLRTSDWQRAGREAPCVANGEVDGHGVQVAILVHGGTHAHLVVIIFA